MTATAATAILGPTLAAQAPAAQGAGAPQAPGAGGARGGPIFWGNSGAGIDPASILAERQGPTKTTGLRFQALVRYGTNLSTETLTLLPLHPLHVVVRMQAVQTCYSTTGQMNLQQNAQNAVVTGHGACRVRSFHGRLSDEGLVYMDDKINEWLDNHPEVEIKMVTTSIGQYEGKIRGGNILLSVHTENRDEVSLAKEIFKRHNGEDISSTGETAPPR